MATVHMRQGYSFDILMSELASHKLSSYVDLILQAQLSLLRPCAADGGKFKSRAST